MGIVDGREKKVGVYVQPVLYGEQVCKHGVCMNELNEVFFFSRRNSTNASSFAVER